VNWDDFDWIGRPVGDGWTRRSGGGSSVAFDYGPPARSPVELPPLPVQPLDEPSEDLDTLVSEWLHAPDQPILGFSRDVLGFDPWPKQAEIVNQIYAHGIRTAVLRLGRRSGKGRISALVGVFEATANAETHLAHVPEGEMPAVAILATSEKQARVIHRFIAAWLRRPGLSHLIARDTDDGIELTTGMAILTLPCAARSTRGYAVAVLVLDEAAWFVDSEGSPMAAEQVWNALAPAVAQFPEGRILVLSTPRWTTGWFANIVRQAASGKFPDMRTWWATTADMNPTISRSFLDAERAKDPAMYAREYEARFIAGIGAVFPDALVRGAVTSQQRGIIAGRVYTVSIDASSGTGKDTFAMVVGSSEGKRVAVRDVRGWRGSTASPVNHRAVLDEIAAVARAHNNASVILDQWASEPIRQGLVERGLTVRLRAWTNEGKEEAITVTRQLLHQSLLELPDHAALISELLTLEQRPLPSGRTRYAAPPGAHDDYATALLALTHELTTRDVWRAYSTDLPWIA